MKRVGEKQISMMRQRKELKANSGVGSGEIFGRTPGGIEGGCGGAREEMRENFGAVGVLKGERRREWKIPLFARPQLWASPTHAAKKAAWMGHPVGRLDRIEETWERHHPTSL